MYQYAELVHWMQNQDVMKILPGEVDIDLTNVCNQDCFYCNSAEFRQERPVQKKYGEYIALLDKLANWRSHTPRSYGTLHTITYPGGGEPTILPGYEKVIEHTIDLGFLTGLTTNGSKLDIMLDKVPVHKLQKMGWIGIDIDAGTEELYEKIRRSLTKKSLFPKVIENAKNLVRAKVNVDLKALLNEYNDTPEAIEDIVKLTADVGARMILFRPTIMNGKAYQISPQTQAIIADLGIKYKVQARVNMDKYLPRTYKKCHQMFQFPVFCADGQIYVCCENKGNPAFSIGHWDTGDFRDLWCEGRHKEVYEKTRVEFCQPCRPNLNNRRIQQIIDNPQEILVLYQ